MNKLRTLGMAVAFALLAICVTTSLADDKPKPKAKGPLGGLLEQLTKLVPDDTQEKLKLTDDQKKQLDQIQQDYEAKVKDGLSDLKDAITTAAPALKKAREDKDKDAQKTAMQPIREKGMGVVQVRREFLSKVQDVLTDEQKKTYEEVKQDLPAPFAGKKPAAKKPAAKPAENTKPAEAKPEEKKPEEKKPAEGKPADPKPTDKKDDKDK
jgi:Spy/CpxP family protein refolding chaperone